MNSTGSPSFVLLIPASHLRLPSKDEPIRESKRQMQRESISEKVDERWRKLGEGGNYTVGEGKDGGNSVREKMEETSSYFMEIPIGGQAEDPGRGGGATPSC